MNFGNSSTKQNPEGLFPPGLSIFQCLVFTVFGKFLLLVYPFVQHLFLASVQARHISVN
jgi:hypothetical protein